MAGPLAGLRVVEMAGLAPAPFACMMLADLGADVVRVERGSGGRGLEIPVRPLDRGRRKIVLDLKSAADRAELLRLVELADVFVEGYRPGVAERLGFGPEDMQARNPGLVYARMTGWGQSGPLAQRAGHDINYIALAGALEPIGRTGERPVPPLNLVGDFGGGGLLMAFGILAALYERQRSGKGQVVDAAMVDGASLLMAFIHGMRHDGMWANERGGNLLDTGAPFYDTYETADGKFVAVGCVEVDFFNEMVRVLGIGPEQMPSPAKQSNWPTIRSLLEAAFKERTRDEWAAIFADSDGCVTPVLSPWEAHEHPHNEARGAFIEVDGLRQPAPAPRFARTECPAPESATWTDAAKVIRVWSAREQALKGQ